jgi:hypothetical protein
MPIPATEKSFPSLLSKTQLAKIRLKAVRAGVWFRALRRIDRALIDLTIMVTSTITSKTLTERLHAILGKLGGTITGNFTKSFREIGANLARKLSLIAQEWGNNTAKNWLSDIRFANFLAVSYGNEHRNWES